MDAAKAIVLVYLAECSAVHAKAVCVCKEIVNNGSNYSTPLVHGPQPGASRLTQPALLTGRCGGAGRAALPAQGARLKRSRLVVHEPRGRLASYALGPRCV